MNMSLILNGIYVLLSSIGIYICMFPIINFIIEKITYKEYINNINTLAEDMKKDDFFKKDENVDLEALKIGMGMELMKSKIEMYVGFLGIFIMAIFLTIKTNIIFTIFIVIISFFKKFLDNFGFGKEDKE